MNADERRSSASEVVGHADHLQFRLSEIQDESDTAIRRMQVFQALRPFIVVRVLDRLHFDNHGFLNVEIGEVLAHDNPIISHEKAVLRLNA